MRLGVDCVGSSLYCMVNWEKFKLDFVVLDGIVEIGSWSDSAARSAYTLMSYLSIMLY